MGSSPSPTVLIVVVVLVVGWGSNWLRKDGRTDEGRKQAAKSKRRMQAAGVSRVPPGNDRGRRTTTTIRATSAYGVYLGKCFFGPWGHRKAPKFSQRHLPEPGNLSPGRSTWGLRPGGTPEYRARSIPKISFFNVDTVECISHGPSPGNIQSSEVGNFIAPAQFPPPLSCA
jgi:hypothetical protein